MAGPRKGFMLLQHTIQPSIPGNNFNVGDAIHRMASMGADTVRVPIFWGSTNYLIRNPHLPALQTSVYGSWNYTQLDYVKGLVAYARTVNPDFKIVAVVGGMPGDIDGAVPTGHWTSTPSGWSQLGYAIAQIVNYLGDTCDHVELGNEPNYRITPDGDGATEVPAQMYAGMAAYTLYWVYSCCGGLNSDGTMNKKVLLGSLATGGHSGIWTEGLSPSHYATVFSTWMHAHLGSLFSSDPTLRDQIYSDWRLSIHPYPRIGDLGGDPVLEPTHPDNETGDLTGVSALDTTWSRYQNFQTQFPNRKIWFTEYGVSSRKVGDPGQQHYHLGLGGNVNSLYSQSDERLEGVLHFGFTDCDPVINDVATGFYEMGVVSKTDGATLKPGGASLSFVYNTLWS